MESVGIVREILDKVTDITLDEFMLPNLNESKLFVKFSVLYQLNSVFVKNRLLSLLQEHFSFEILKAYKGQIMHRSSKLFQIFRLILYKWEEWNPAQKNVHILLQKLNVFLSDHIEVPPLLSRGHRVEAPILSKSQIFRIISHVKQYYDQINKSIPTARNTLSYKSFLSKEEINIILEKLQKLREMLKQKAPTNHCVQELKLFSEFTAYISQLTKSKNIDEFIRKNVIRFVDECSHHKCFKDLDAFKLFRLYIIRLFARERGQSPL